MMEPKRKRGRPPKVHKSPLLQPVEFPASHLNETSARDLNYGYKILQEILNVPKSRLILEKPDESLFGLHDYYEVIKRPMWLTEVSRKYNNKEYNELKDVIEDFKLILENCYRFWGANHKFSKHTFRIEKILEKHLKELPGNLKSSCNLLADSTNNDNSNESDSALLEEYQSKILQNLGKKEKDESEILGDTAEEELLNWESDVLMGKHVKKQINFIGELADIGYFIKLTHQVLCVKQVTQYEIERMLLMPKESTTLATLMTAFLCPTAMRGSLYLKPLMTYEVWAAILSRKLDSWYNAYLKLRNKIQIFLKYGIEPNFWDVVGDQNPLLTSEFHALSLVKKAWILKALCTTIFHSNKKIEEYFATLEDCKLRGNIIYEDSKFIYINEFSPEIRIYRIAKQEGDYSNILKDLIPDFSNTSSPSTQEDGQNATLSKKQRFILVASDRESLKLLITTFNRKKKSVFAVEKLLAIEQNKKLSLKGLSSMYSQWKKFSERLPKVVETSKNYWINKVSSSSQLLNAEGEADSANNESSLIIFGKRPSKKKFTFQEIHSSSSNEEKLSEASTSDWEDGNIRRSKRIKRIKTFPRQWERRFEEGIYETYSRAMNTAQRTFNNNYPSRISTTELSNPNDYVKFLRQQQRKINSFYNIKKQGLIIRKTIINPTKRSIVSAAVENAIKQTENKEENLQKSQPKVLMISMGNSTKTLPVSDNTQLNSEPNLPIQNVSCLNQNKTVTSVVSTPSVSSMSNISPTQLQTKST
ncbi:uncharacterized protein isoform X2 [Rhodnius prolixus]|uniref:uncharacterized protein isoform X2 n=1 Tax=Rhodnius prolixus TaxID=13249 RepID=UPI003D18D079